MDSSFWEKDVFWSTFDALVLGSGIVGLNAALRLREVHPSWRIGIIERGPIPLGASTRNAGFACFGSPSELLADLQHMSEDALCTLVERRYRGIQQVRKLLGDQAINYEPSGGFEVFLPEEQERFESIQAQLPKLNKLLKPIFDDRAFKIISPSNKLHPTAFPYLISAPFEGMLHPGKMIKRLIEYVKEQEIELFNGLTVDKIEPEAKLIRLITSSSLQLTTRNLLICTNGFTKHFFPELHLKPARNQVIMTESIPNLNLRGCYHYEEGYVYFRNVGNRILLGGFRHVDPLTETTTDLGQTPTIQKALTDFLHRCLVKAPHITITDRWSGILGVGDSKQPILQAIQPNMVLSVRLGGMGVAIGTQLGREAADMLEG